MEGFNQEAERLLARHHRFAISVTLFQVAVALCAIAALTKRKPLWGVALAASMIALACSWPAYWHQREQAQATLSY